MPKYDVTIHIEHGYISAIVDAEDSDEAFDVVYDTIGLTQFAVDSIEVDEVEDA